MAAYFNQATLINEVLARLGVLATGQAVDPEDYAYVASMVDPTFRKLAALEICYAPDPNNIPGPWLMDLADILAGECAMKFGVSNDDYVKLVNRGLGGAQGVDMGAGAAAISLRHQRRGKPTFEILKTYSY